MFYKLVFPLCVIAVAAAASNTTPNQELQCHLISDLLSNRTLIESPGSPWAKDATRVRELAATAFISSCSTFSFQFKSSPSSLLSALSSPTDDGMNALMSAIGRLLLRSPHVFSPSARLISDNLQNGERIRAVLTAALTESSSSSSFISLPTYLDSFLGALDDTAPRQQHAAAAERFLDGLQWQAIDQEWKDALSGQRNSNKNNKNSHHSHNPHVALMLNFHVIRSIAAGIRMETLEEAIVKSVIARITEKAVTATDWGNINVADDVLTLVTSIVPAALSSLNDLLLQEKLLIPSVFSSSSSSSSSSSGSSNSGEIDDDKNRLFVHHNKRADEIHRGSNSYTQQQGEVEVSGEVPTMAEYIKKNYPSQQQQQQQQQRAQPVSSRVIDTDIREKEEDASSNSPRAPKLVSYSLDSDNSNGIMMDEFRDEDEL